MIHTHTHTRAHTHTQFLWKEWINVSYHSLSHHCPDPILVVHKRIWALSSFPFIIWPTLYYWTFPANPLVAPLLFSRSVMFNSFGTSWTVTGQGPLSMGFSRQEYRSGLPSPPPGRGSSWPRNPTCTSCIAGGFFTTETPGNPYSSCYT